MRAVNGLTLLVCLTYLPFSGSRLHAQDRPIPEEGLAFAVSMDRPAPQTRGIASEPESVVIREPSQGRPIFITPGDTFFFIMRLPPDLRGDVVFALAHAREPGLRVNLSAESPPSYVNNEYCHLVLKVPEATQPGLYDVEVRGKTKTHTAKHSVRVVDRFKTKFRAVHLSSMNVGDLTAPDFDDMLPAEINLLAPEFIIATGDYTEWARARDDAASWQRVLKFFEKFDAPVFMLCGVHDHEASFSRFVASKPIGTLDYGPYHGLLLLDHPGHPIDQDVDQLKWIDADLKQNRNKKFNFIASSSDELALLDIWRERGDASKYVAENKIKMFLTGGSTDWDFKEFADKIKGLDGIHFIRTHESSTCLRDRATGVSHYRVLDFDGEQVAYTYPNDTATENLQHSVPTGRLRTFFDAPNDGTVRRVGVTVQNALNQPFPDARVWLRIAKQGDASKPNVAPGRLVQALDVGKYWACDVAFDLPDKGAVRILASTDPKDIPAAVPVTVAFDGPTEWKFAPRTTEFGLSYFASDAKVTLKLTNESKSPLSCWPVIRVNGAQIQTDPTACPRLPITLEPGKALSMPLVLNLRRLSPGPHVLQVHFLDDPLSRLHTFEVNLASQ